MCVSVCPLVFLAQEHTDGFRGPMSWGSSLITGQLQQKVSHLEQNDYSLLKIPQMLWEADSMQESPTA